jgi:hypothetical protein
MTKIVFYCSCGAGNRINLIISAYLVYYLLPDIEIFIHWNNSNHFGLTLEDLFYVDKFPFKFKHLNYIEFMHYTRKPNIIRADYLEHVKWFNSDSKGSNKWNDKQTWLDLPKDAELLCLDYRVFEFATLEETRKIIEVLPFKEEFHKKCDDVIKNMDEIYTIQLRVGDMIKMICNDEQEKNLYVDMEQKTLEVLNICQKNNKKVFLFSDDKNIVDKYQEKYSCIIKRNMKFPTYMRQNIVFRYREDTVDSIVDLLIMFKSKVLLYSPYSSFSQLGLLGSLSWNKAPRLNVCYGVKNVEIIDSII